MPPARWCAWTSASHEGSSPVGRPALPTPGLRGDVRDHQRRRPGLPRGHPPRPLARSLYATGGVGARDSSRASCSGVRGGGRLLGVMGLQPVKDVTLIRHAYVTSARRGEGIGGNCLSTCSQRTAGPILVGTWAAAEWAVRFYEKHGFRRVDAGRERPVAADLLVHSRTTGRDFGGTHSCRVLRSNIQELLIR